MLRCVRELRLSHRFLSLHIGNLLYWHGWGAAVWRYRLMEALWLCQHSDKGLSRLITLVESDSHEEEPESGTGM